MTNNYLLQCAKECLPEFQIVMNKTQNVTSLMFDYAAHFTTQTSKS